MSDPTAVSCENVLVASNVTVCSCNPFQEPIQIDEAAGLQYLTGKGWPIGLQQELMKNLLKMPYRFFICDNSGSMISGDGERVVRAGLMYKNLKCTRWTELTNSLRFHAELVDTLKSPTEFRLLNNAEPLILGSQEQPNLSNLMKLLDTEPEGTTPLCRHILEVTANIREMEQTLRTTGVKVALIIATDGEASDGDVANALRPLQSLPVWVIVRLCTNDPKIVSFWNHIDDQLELEIDVIDDHIGESKEVASHNSWLTYGEPLHRLREFGVLMKEIDMIDERTLTVEQAFKVCSMILGMKESDLPHPGVDLEGFLEAIKGPNKSLGEIWNPAQRTNSLWINVDRFRRTYGDKKFMSFFLSWKFVVGIFIFCFVLSIVGGTRLTR